MHPFKDTKDREWKIEISVGAISEVKDSLGIDLLKFFVEKDGDAIEHLTEDLPLLCQVIFTLCDAQAKADNVSPEDFSHAMGGDALEDALNALMEELADFSPRQKRKAMHLMLQKGKTLMEKMCDLAMAELEALDLDEEASRLMASGNSSGNSPESPESIPDP